MPIWARNGARITWIDFNLAESTYISKLLSVGTCPIVSGPARINRGPNLFIDINYQNMVRTPLIVFGHSQARRVFPSDILVSVPTVKQTAKAIPDG